VHVGGQGVYLRHLSRELAALGHDVEVLSGPPYPQLDDVPGVRLTELPSLDLYREPDPFRHPKREEFHSAIDVLEYAGMLSASFPEPIAFSLRAWRELRARPRDERPDVVHDNQTLGYGMLLLQRDGFNVVATVHHPITVDRRLQSAVAPPPANRAEQFLRWRNGSFVRMQKRVVRRLPSVLTVSESSRRDIIADFEVDPARLSVIPVGVDVTTFRPSRNARVPGRLISMASSDIPLKGTVPLLEAVALLRRDRDVELVIVGSSKEGSSARQTIERLGLADCVQFVAGLEESALVELFGTAEVGVVPSLYEGFSLPAIEMMACATPLVVTTAGALPEVVGPDGLAAFHVPPGDPNALAGAIGRLLDDAELRARLGAAGRSRVTELYDWRMVAERTVGWYRERLPQPALR
jgi:glycosyltransferase involved in cell wall biosynthesis